MGSSDAPLRVGLLADTIDKPGGIPRYTRELVAALGRRADVRLVVAAPGSATATVELLAADRLEELVTIPSEAQLQVALWERYRSGAAFARAGAEVVHGTKHLVPRGMPRTVLTVHDLMTITRARESRLAKRVLLPAQFRASLRQATRLLAVSGATRDRIAALEPRWGAKTVVIPNGLSDHLLTAPSRPVPELATRPFALVVGDLSPRKNVALLLRIWPEVAAVTGLVLAVVGHEGPHSDDARRDLAALEARGIARWVQGATDGALRWCYEHATVVLFPSLEEGFGFPVLEALAFDAPMIASTDPALVEVSAGSERVRHVDGRDDDTWRDAIVTAAAVVRSPPSAPHRPSGASTWDEHAAAVVGLYREISRPS
jgi:glycosyltransferase involved in cell wall biosynthesis